MKKLSKKERLERRAASDRIFTVTRKGRKIIDKGVVTEYGKSLIKENKSAKSNDISLAQLDTKKKTGREKFFFDDKSLDYSLIEFWQWHGSDLVSNATRGVLAEFIVAKALEIRENVRSEWDPYDFMFEKNTKIEVKSASYLQTWSQKKLSSISFDIRPTVDWESWTENTESKPKRQADVYIFCLLKHKDKNTLNPLKLEQWDFYVLSTSKLDNNLPTQKRISLSRLLKLNPFNVEYPGIKNAVYNCISK